MTLGVSLLGAPLVVYANEEDSQAILVSNDCLMSFLYWSKSLDNSSTQWNYNYLGNDATIPSGTFSLRQSGSGGSGTEYIQSAQVTIKGNTEYNHFHLNYSTGQLKGTYSGNPEAIQINNTDADGNSYGDYAFVFFLRENLSIWNFSTYQGANHVNEESDVEIKLSGWAYLDYATTLDGYRLCYVVYHNMKMRSLVFNNLTSKEVRVIPIYNGLDSNMPDDVRRIVHRDSELVEQTDKIVMAIQEGNSTSTAVISNNEAIQNDFDNLNTDYHTYENNINNDMNTAYNNVSMTNNLYSNNKFIASANWVKTQFERIVLNTPFELIIVFSLILGIALIFAGKVR